MKIIILSALLLIFSLPLAAGATEFNYSCYCYHWNGYYYEKGTMDLTLNSNFAKANIIEVSWDDDSLGGSIDTKYRSRGSVKYVKFGKNLIVEESMLTGGKKLKDGNMGGFVRVEGRAEGGFYQYKFVCRR